MADFSFIHAADIHLDSPLKGLAAYEGAPVEVLRAAPRAAFEKLVSEAIGENIDFMIIAGDLYDGDWDDINTGLFFSSQMGRLKRADIPVFIVHGNHDAESKMSKRLTLPDNVTVFSSRKAETVLLEKFDVVLHGQSFRHAKTEENLAIDYPVAVSGCFNIGVLHTALDGHTAHASYAPCSLSDLVSKEYDYWALGHVHEYRIASEEPLVVFPGNIQGRHIRETGPRGAVLVHVENGITSHERLLVDTLRWQLIELNVGSAQSFDDVVQLAHDQLALLLKNNAGGHLMAVRMVLSGNTTAHGALFGLETQLRQEILNAANMLSDDELWIEKIVLNTMPELDAKVIEARFDALSDLQAILAEAGQDEAIGQRIREEIMAFVSKAPHELVEAVPELDTIRTGNIRELFEPVSMGLIARLSGEGEQK
jgi:DNA repair exonuclease SbcCD nuclease subunit